MTKLYVANTTKQRFTFTFRRPETNKLYHRFINPGSQELVFSDITAAELDAVIAHFAPYGMIDYRSIDQAKAFIGQCYSIDKPVPASVIEKALRDNDTHLDRAAVENRKAQIAAQSDFLSKNETGFRGNLESETNEVAGPHVDKSSLVTEQLVIDEGTAKKATRGRSKK